MAPEIALLLSPLGAPSPHASSSALLPPPRREHACSFVPCCWSRERAASVLALESESESESESTLSGLCSCFPDAFPPPPLRSRSGFCGRLSSPPSFFLCGFGILCFLFALIPGTEVPSASLLLGVPHDSGRHQPAGGSPGQVGRAASAGRDLGVQLRAHMSGDGRWVSGEELGGEGGVGGCLS